MLKCWRHCVTHSRRNIRLYDIMKNTPSLFYTKTHAGLTELFVIMPPSESAHHLTEMLLKLWIFTVMLTGHLLSYGPSVTCDSRWCLCTTSSETHTNTLRNTQLSLPCHCSRMPSLRHFYSRHLNGHLSSVSRPSVPTVAPCGYL